MDKKIILYPKDIQVITGKSYYTSYKLLRRIKNRLNKSSKQVVSVEEFCAYMGLKVREVEAVLRGR
jgi:hypothetical protein